MLGLSQVGNLIGKSLSTITNGFSVETPRNVYINNSAMNYVKENISVLDKVLGTSVKRAVFGTQTSINPFTAYAEGQGNYALQLQQNTDVIGGRIDEVLKYAQTANAAAIYNTYLPKTIMLLKSLVEGSAYAALGVLPQITSIMNDVFIAMGGAENIVGSLLASHALSELIKNKERQTGELFADVYNLFYTTYSNERKKGEEIEVAEKTALLKSVGNSYEDLLITEGRSLYDYVTEKVETIVSTHQVFTVSDIIDIGNELGLSTYELLHIARLLKKKQFASQEGIVFAEYVNNVEEYKSRIRLLLISLVFYKRAYNHPTKYTKLLTKANLHNKIDYVTTEGKRETLYIDNELAQVLGDDEKKKEVFIKQLLEQYSKDKEQAYAYKIDIPKGKKEKETYTIFYLTGDDKDLERIFEISNYLNSNNNTSQEKIAFVVSEQLYQRLLEKDALFSPTLRTKIRQQIGKFITLLNTPDNRKILSQLGIEPSLITPEGLKRLDDIELLNTFLGTVRAFEYVMSAGKGIEHARSLAQYVRGTGGEYYDVMNILLSRAMGSNYSYKQGSYWWQRLFDITFKGLLVPGAAVIASAGVIVFMGGRLIGNNSALASMFITSIILLASFTVAAISTMYAYKLLRFSLNRLKVNLRVNSLLEKGVYNIKKNVVQHKLQRLYENSIEEAREVAKKIDTQKERNVGKLENVQVRFKEKMAVAMRNFVNSWIQRAHLWNPLYTKHSALESFKENVYNIQHEKMRQKMEIGKEEVEKSLHSIEEEIKKYLTDPQTGGELGRVIVERSQNLAQLITFLHIVLHQRLKVFWEEYKKKATAENIAQFREKLQAIIQFTFTPLLPSSLVEEGILEELTEQIASELFEHPRKYNTFDKFVELVMTKAKNLLLFDNQQQSYTVNYNLYRYALYRFFETYVVMNKKTINFIKEQVTKYAINKYRMLKSNLLPITTQKLKNATPSQVKEIRKELYDKVSKEVSNIVVEALIEGRRNIARYIRHLPVEYKDVYLSLFPYIDKKELSQDIQKIIKQKNVINKIVDSILIEALGKDDSALKEQLKLKDKKDIKEAEKILAQFIQNYLLGGALIRQNTVVFSLGQATFNIEYIKNIITFVEQSMAIFNKYKTLPLLLKDFLNALEDKNIKIIIRYKHSKQDKQTHTLTLGFRDLFKLVSTLPSEQRKNFYISLMSVVIGAYLLEGPQKIMKGIQQYVTRWLIENKKLLKIEQQWIEKIEVEVSPETATTVTGKIENILKQYFNITDVQEIPDFAIQDKEEIHEQLSYLDIVDFIHNVRQLNTEQRLDQFQQEIQKVKKEITEILSSAQNTVQPSVIEQGKRWLQFIEYYEQVVEQIKQLRTHIQLDELQEALLKAVSEDKREVLQELFVYSKMKHKEQYTETIQELYENIKDNPVLVSKLKETLASLTLLHKKIQKLASTYHKQVFNLLTQDEELNVFAEKHKLIQPLVYLQVPLHIAKDFYRAYSFPKDILFNEGDIYGKEKQNNKSQTFAPE